MAEGPARRSSAARVPSSSEAGGPGAWRAQTPVRFDPDLGGSKLCRPEDRADLVVRRRLVSAFVREIAPLIVVSAPSGSGKTLAVSQWLEADERPSAWLHLDGGDDDPVTLLHYLSRALEDVASVPAAVHSWLRLPQPPVAEAIVPALVSAVAAARPFVLVLDDVHRVRDERSWAAAWQVLTALPDGSVAALCGRTDPPLPLARLRTVGGLAEVRFAQLAFDREELAELLRLRGLEARPDLVSDLLETTEGWAVGSYLAVVAMARPDGREARLTTAATAREVQDYLTSEVLAEQPEETVDFLLRTSIVERVSPDLCDALTGRLDGAALLERVERDNLFVIALDRERGWYRYHRLFSAALRAELGRRAPTLVCSLHRKAAVWFQARDQVRHAVRHWLAAGDLSAAGDLVAGRWLSRYDSGRILTASLWLDEFEPDQYLAHPPLTVAAAWVKALTRRAGQACHLLGALDSSALDADSFDGTASLRSSAALLDALSVAPGRPRCWRRPVWLWSLSRNTGASACGSTSRATWPAWPRRSWRSRGRAHGP